VHSHATGTRGDYRALAARNLELELRAEVLLIIIVLLGGQLHGGCPMATGLGARPGTVLLLLAGVPVAGVQPLARRHCNRRAKVRMCGCVHCLTNTSRDPTHYLAGCSIRVQQASESFMLSISIAMSNLTSHIEDARQYMLWGSAHRPCGRSRCCASASHPPARCAARRPPDCTAGSRR